MNHNGRGLYFRKVHFCMTCILMSGRNVRNIVSFTRTRLFVKINVKEMHRNLKYKNLYRVLIKKHVRYAQQKI